MSDLHWDEVWSFFDPDLMGSLPDVFVLDASVEDWQAVFDLVQARGWRWEFVQGGTALPLPPATEALARPAGAEVVELKVWPVPGVLAISRPTSVSCALRPSRCAVVRSRPHANRIRSSSLPVALSVELDRSSSSSCCWTRSASAVRPCCR